MPLALKLKPGDKVQIGENVEIVAMRGKPGTIHLAVRAPEEMKIDYDRSGRVTEQQSPTRK